ncbi:histidine kinase dimerization/phospho-acceptor domain-containing protein [Paludifilum halophilum]|uniref:histidine kinase n=1 Tax=Paludifilum halophilum TaxID=1642702 RepID=A0A235B577_9BACL|nr:histidine kinase dimerization/phospho-acceptor domain-containing protein [Paludifilum halophilum]OYD06765.1 hypothetical protein CHM34_14505 [Paludifilum halophilum]
MYFLTKTLSRPVVQVAKAAKQIEEGNYEISLPPEKPQREVNDLVQSFQTMADRLEHLEKLRTELLAGVTHELKTSVTSISGLLRAVKDGVVSNKEADSFVETALEETERLQTMVTDLLELNSFSAKGVPLEVDTHSFYEVVSDPIIISIGSTEQKERFIS